MTHTTKERPVSFTPELRSADPLANYWIRQVNLRLRREVAWMRYQRGLPPEGEHVLPPYVDDVQHTLDLSRFWSAKQAFFAEDTTARYLTEQIALSSPPPEDVRMGSFSWVVQELSLDRLACFTLALGVASAFDGTLPSVIAACLNDPAAGKADMSLVQTLWDEPASVVEMAGRHHRLFRYGLLQSELSSADAAAAWEQPFGVPPLIAQQLLLDTDLPDGVAPLDEEPVLASRTAIVAARLAACSRTRLQVVPVRGPRGAAARQVVAGLARAAARPVLALSTPGGVRSDEVSTLAVLCWLRGDDLFFDADSAAALLDDHGRLSLDALPPASLPVTLYVVTRGRDEVAAVPETVRTPAVEVPTLTYTERTACWHRELGERGRDIEDAIPEVSRRFRYEKEMIRRIADELKKLPEPASRDHLIEACRAEVEVEIGELAQPVTPRFEGEQLILPQPQDLQFDELARAVRSLAAVHYEWGTADAWNEGGITALFAGPSGTGKTMGAEILARRLELPMYRVDLSQVANKYIGETEKNLKRLFDAADTSDLLLFFDEADAIFGRRTEVKDAHDRYANLEVSYLLERMERFKGVAILASNRKKDLDEAFTRRLHFVIDFPMPEAPQREAIWRQVIPDGVDTSDIDFAFLARQFQLTGGHIRSIIFQACLQRAAHASNGHRALGMDDVIVAVKRELDKLGRPLTLHQFGPYADLVESISASP